ncbi:UNVERIFIED_CONTAM: hypothetical protein FKN15_030331 [Acipenser sinensis]
MTRGSEGEAAPRKRKGTVPARSLSPLLFEDGTGEDTESSAAAQEHKKKKKKKKVKEKRAEHGQLKEAGERDGGHKKKKVKHSDGDENLEAETTEEVEIPLKKKKKKKHRRDVMEQEGESNDDVNPSGQPKDEESCLEAVGSERKEVKVEIKGSYPVTPWTAEEKKMVIKPRLEWIWSGCKNKGRWSYKERRILLKVMEDELRKTLDPAEMTDLEQGATPERNARLLTIIREKLYQNIHWVDVAAKVKTRNWVQCRQKWDVPPFCVQRMFTRLKVSHVPMWKSKSFGDIIDFLHENTVPALKEKISKTRRHDKEGVRDSYECHKTFNFSDIFYESDTDLETEELDQEM